MKTTRIIAYILLLLSLSIAGIAAYFSISGLSELFAATMWAVIIMASILEAGKLGATFFLHRYWEELPLFKYPLALMVAILMTITSMGIFGFLSKGHLEQEAPIAEMTFQVEQFQQRNAALDLKISQEQSKISAAEQELQGLEAIVDKLLEHSVVNDSGNRKGALSVQEDQEPERQAIRDRIRQATTAIDQYQSQKQENLSAITNIKSKQSAIEAKLGPVKYIAELFGLDKDDDGTAVRLLIVMLMIAFDPLAIILVMAFNWCLIKAETEQADAVSVAQEPIPSEEPESPATNTQSKSLKFAFEQVEPISIETPVSDDDSDQPSMDESDEVISDEFATKEDESVAMPSLEINNYSEAEAYEILSNMQENDLEEVLNNATEDERATIANILKNGGKKTWANKL